MDPNTELRNLSPGYIFQLVQILEPSDSWKQLMEVIPKFLDSTETFLKYSSDQIKLIESASRKQGREASAILFEEWGCSGKLRPRLRHLLDLLIKAELYRAADYVAVTLLNKSTPERPQSGPAAKINISDLRTETNSKMDTNEINGFLNEISYASSLITDFPEMVSYDKNKIVKRTPAEYEKVKIHINMNTETITDNIISDEQNVESRSLVQREKQLEKKIEMLTVCTQKYKYPTNDHTFQNSNLIQFSQSHSFDENPAFSTLLNDSECSLNELSVSIDVNDISNTVGDSNDVQENFNEMPIPALSTLLLSENNIENRTNVVLLSDDNIQISSDSEILTQNNEFKMLKNAGYNIPLLSEIINSDSSLSPINNNNFEENITNFNVENIEKQNSLHNFSKMLKNSKIPAIEVTDLNLPNISILQQTTVLDSTNFIPNLSELQLDNSENSTHLSINTNVKSNVLSSIDSRNNCNSPLPNLSLNTMLPHFSYNELEQSTNYFDKTSHRLNSSLEDRSDFIGRKLGSGAFGSVYLALGLLNKPIAVKKLNLNGVEVVDVDDTITKQFRNEVELLYKYRHENLLSLIGYSCDGPTYCLLYEYISGGSLKDKLQYNSELLQWKERLNIAYGTAKAVSYLHSAYDTPLIHRDIKSANILLDCKSNPKLCDFGLIKLIPNQNTSTATTVFGTSAYMAPEAFRGDVSIKIDTFSFGVVLLELLTSLPPLDESREGTDLVTHIEDNCEDSISNLLDLRAGSWTDKSVHYADEIFEIANLCLEEKKRRPTMTVICDYFKTLMEK